MIFILKIIKYQLHDILRSKWLFTYSIFFFLISYSLFNFADESSKVMLSLMNIELIVVPLVSVIFGSTYYYNSKEYIIFLLSQPIKRNYLFIGLWLGLALPLILGTVMGIFIPFLIFNSSIGGFDFLLLILISTVQLTFVFVALSFFISVINEDKAKGLGISILLWLTFSILYDGLILLVTILFNDYPLEMPTLILTFFNPIDLARILMMLNLDISALMGYTGAVFQKFFGSSFGIISAILMLTFWAFIPFWFGLKSFMKKDF